MPREPLFQFPDRPISDSAFSGPKIALIHGLMARSHMQRHLLHYLRDQGHTDTTMYGHLHSPRAIAEELRSAVDANRKIALIGYSQGGFQAVEVARELHGAGVPVDLLVTIAAGGLGRAFPGRWRAEPRQIPSNVKQCINLFSEGDILGCDRRYQRNLATPTMAGQFVENHGFSRVDGISHIDLVRCYPEGRVHPQVRSLVLGRLMRELSLMENPG
ncbi:esterase/lipase family protein [Marinobacter nitratireducens]|nr:alpha/beta hydrolase [Marinobacter nitratireducens]